MSNRKSMTIRHADAPLQKAVIENIYTLLANNGRAHEVPEDGYDRVDYRLEIVLAPYDDDEPDEPGQPVRDLLTDVLHLCDAKGWDIQELLANAAWMRDEENREWGER
jgi:hypothetical protein